MSEKEKNKPREYTEDEVRIEFIKFIRFYIDYWEKNDKSPSVRSNLEGLAHSILFGIDSCALRPSLPKFILAPDPHPDDKKDDIRERKNYYPDNYKSRVKCDISGYLHELLHNYELE